ncbi:MAG: tetratricopeptide repeat protein [Bacteroidota bacterium]|jgi:Tfp pilus assembly protein PilF|nr:MAG: enzyme of heme biosynthesis [Bacteroidota bacterium]
MNSERLKMLHQFAEEEPGNAFNWYALALEYQHSDPSQASQLFEKLMTEFESYLPTYYMAANHYLRQGDTEKAVSIFRKGIEIAEQQGDRKAAGELRSGLDEVLFE